jgi:hypothetical protein
MCFEHTGECLHDLTIAPKPGQGTDPAVLSGTMRAGGKTQERLVIGDPARVLIVVEMVR